MDTHAPLSDEQLHWLRFYFGVYCEISRETWPQLAARRVRVFFSLYPADLTFLYALTPAERRESVARWLADMFARISAAAPLQDVQQSRHGLPYQLFDCSLLARDFPRLLEVKASLPDRFSIQVRGVEGLEPMEDEKERQPKKRERGKREWYAVHARFAIQIEGETQGMQTYEDRIVLLRAWTFEDAERRFHSSPEVVNYNRPYFNSDYQLVRWQFERILDIYQTSISLEGGFKPSGVEVYSTLRRRHLRPEYVWRGEGLLPAPDDGSAQS